MRFDIQFMRGVAVLAVVVFHAFGQAIPRGFLGVDIFFVVSGFLITGIILKGLSSPKGFSFRNFYVRRAKRLLPASFLTLGVTTLLAGVFLTRSQTSEYAEQLLGSLAFAANFVLAGQTGYFEGAAETKPLLHIWSLSLEEQFYFVAPLLLWLTPLRARPWLLGTGMVLSLALCVVAMTGPWDAQTLAFYMLPTRAWELLAGSLCAWWMLRRPEQTIPVWAKFTALAAILLTCTVGFDPIHPRGDSVIVVLATAVILLGKDGWLPANALTLPVRAVGDWSYSLYLIHWPLFSFAYIAWSQHPPVLVMVGLALLAIGLAWLQYRFVESPFRGDWSGFRISPAWVLAGAAAVMVAFAVPGLGVTSPAAEQIRAVRGLDASCDQRGGEWIDLSACRTSEKPNVAVWGDSYAMQWLPGLEGLSLVPDDQDGLLSAQGCVPDQPEAPAVMVQRVCRLQ